jgi:hypothetical protein
VQKHIAATRKIFGLTESTAVLMLESNLGFESQHILHYVQQAGVKRWLALAEGQGGSLGWLCTNDRKEAMCLQMREALRVGSCGLSDGFFSNTMSEVEALKNVQEELARFSVIVEPAKTSFGKVRKTYSGKVGGQNDDLSIVMQMCISGLRCFYQSDKYANFRPEL